MSHRNTQPAYFSFLAGREYFLHAAASSLHSGLSCREGSPPPSELPIRMPDAQIRTCRYFRGIFIAMLSFLFLILSPAKSCLIMIPPRAILLPLSMGSQAVMFAAFPACILFSSAAHLSWVTISLRLPTCPHAIELHCLPPDFCQQSRAIPILSPPAQRPLRVLFRAAAHSFRPLF